MSQVTDVAAPKPAPQKPNEPSQVGNVVSFLTSRLRQIGIFIALVLIVVLFQILTQGTLLQPRNVTSIVVQNAYILILAIGMVMIIIAGHIDLSVGSVVAFVGAMSGVFAVNWGWPWWASILASLVIGALVGAWQGFWVAYVGIPAFIVTLAGMLTFRGLAQIVLNNRPITPFPDEYVAVGAGYLPDPSNGTSILEWITVALGVAATLFLVVQQVRERAARVKLNLEDEPFAWFVTKIAFIAVLVLGVTYLLASYKGTPIVLVILAALVLLYTAVMHRSIFGRHIYARGGNLNAAQLSGVNTKRVDFLLFVNMGVLAALAGIAFTARSDSALPGAGSGFELDAIAAVFIGGAAVTGGIGTVTGAMIGGLIMGVLNNGMSLLGLGTEYQSLIKGMVLLLAVAFDVFNKSRGAKASS